MAYGDLKSQIRSSSSSSISSRPDLDDSVRNNVLRSADAARTHTDVVIDHDRNRAEAAIRIFALLFTMDCIEECNKKITAAALISDLNAPLHPSSPSSRKKLRSSPGSLSFSGTEYKISISSAAGDDDDDPLPHCRAKLADGAYESPVRLGCLRRLLSPLPGPPPHLCNRSAPSSFALPCDGGDFSLPCQDRCRTCATDPPPSSFALSCDGDDFSLPCHHRPSLPCHHRPPPPPLSPAMAARSSMYEV